MFVLVETTIATNESDVICMNRSYSQTLTNLNAYIDNSYDLSEITIYMVSKTRLDIYSLPGYVSGRTLLYSYQIVHHQGESDEESSGYEEEYSEEHIEQTLMLE